MPHPVSDPRGPDEAVAGCTAPVFVDGTPGMADRLERFQVDLLVLDAAPPARQTRYRASFPYRSSPAAPAQHGLGKHASRELATLIRIRDVWQTLAGERFIQRFDGMHRFQRDDDPGAQEFCGSPGPLTPSGTRSLAPSEYRSCPAPKTDWPD